MKGFLSQLLIALMLVQAIAPAAALADKSFGVDNLKFGVPTSGNDKTLELNLGLGSSDPKIRYSLTDSKLEFSNDGTNFLAFGSGNGSGVNYIGTPDAESGLGAWTTYNADQAVTISIASPAVFTTSSAHGLQLGDPVELTTTGALPTGLATGTTYYVCSTPTSTTFSVAASAGGTCINTSGTQSGVQTFFPQNPPNLSNPNSGGSPAITWTTTTSSPLHGTKSFLFTKPASTTMGQGVYYDFTIDNADQAHQESITFDYSVISGIYTSPVSPTITAPTDLQVWIYDKTNGTRIQPAGSYVLANAVGSPSVKFQGTFQAASNSTSYRLFIQNATMNGSAFAVEADSISVGPVVQTYGAPITDPVSFSASGTWTSNTTYSGQWSRSGKYLYEEVTANLSGAPNAAQLVFNLPPGLSADTGAMTASGTGGNETGFCVGQHSGTGYSFDTVYSSTTAFYPVWQSSVTAPSQNIVNATTPVTWASGDKITCNYHIPILGWSSSTVVSSDAATQVVAMKAHASTGASMGTISGSYTPIIFNTPDSDSLGQYNSSTGVYTIAVPGYYDFSASLIVDGTSWGASSGVDVDLYNVTSSSEIAAQGYLSAAAGSGDSKIFGALNVKSIYLPAGTQVEIRAQTTGSVTSASYFTSTTVDYFSLSRQSGPNQIAAADAVNARYTFAGNSTVPNNTNTNLTSSFVTYTKSFDSNNAFNTTTGIYTIPAPGSYRVTLRVAFSPSTANSGINSSTIVQSGSASTSSQSPTPFTTSGQPTSSTVVDTFHCQAGDTIQLQAYQNNSTNALEPSTFSPYNVFTIERVGN